MAKNLARSLSGIFGAQAAKLGQHSPQTNNLPEFVVSKLDFLINWARRSSMWYAPLPPRAPAATTRTTTRSKSSSKSKSKSRSE